MKIELFYAKGPGTKKRASTKCQFKIILIQDIFQRWIDARVSAYFQPTITSNSKAFFQQRDAYRVPILRNLSMSALRRRVKKQ